MATFWDEITRDDLPSDLQDLERELGMEAVRHLVETWGGTQLYIHSPDTIRDSVAARVVQKEYDGRNEGSLAQRLGVSRRFVYDLLSGRSKKRKTARKQTGGQPGLFGEEG